MFGEWNDDEWCQFDNYMIKNLQMYLDSGLLKSEFVNLRIRKLSAKTGHDFIEWCGLIGTNPHQDKLKFNEKLYKNDLYLDFIEENPDRAPKSKMTISRIRFYKWLTSYAIYQYNTPPEEGRDNIGKWIKFVSKHSKEYNGKLKL